MYTLDNPAPAISGTHMRPELISRMSKIISGGSLLCVNDFKRYDAPTVDSATSDDFPMLWRVSDNSTTLVSPSRYRFEFFENERTRYLWAQSNTPFEWLLHPHEGSRYFLITLDNVFEIDHAEASRICDNSLSSTVRDFQKHYPLPVIRPIPIRFSGITLSRLKSLIRESARRHSENPEYGDLHSIFNHLRNHIRVSSDQLLLISYDESDNCFYFEEFHGGLRYMNGGIIFHGDPETGYIKNNSVQLTPSYGWHLHT